MPAVLVLIILVYPHVSCSTRELFYRRSWTLVIRKSGIDSGMSSPTVSSIRSEQCDQELSRRKKAEADVYEVAVQVGLQLSDRQSRSVIGESKKERMIQAWQTRSIHSLTLRSRRNDRHLLHNTKLWEPVSCQRGILSREDLRR